MADKGKRVASRQAQLKRRKRKGKARSHRFDAGPGEVAATTPEVAASGATESTTPEPTSPAAPAAAQTTLETLPDPSRTAASIRTSKRGRAAARAEAAATYPYLGVELRHIGVVASVLAVALVVLTLLLR